MTMVTASSMLVVMPSHADEKTECVAAHAAAQKLRREGRFRAARGELARCTRAACPAPVRNDCATYAQELDAVQPTIALEVRDPDGRPTLEGTYTLDGAPEVRALTPLVIEVDPGEHVLNVFLAGGASRSAKFVAREGAPRQLVSVAFPERGGPGESATEPSREHRPVPAAAWIVGAFGGVALVAGGTFGVLALSGRASLRDECGVTRTCSDDDLARVRRHAAFADIGLGIGVAALVTSAIIIITR